MNLILCFVAFGYLGTGMLVVQAFGFDGQARPLRRFLVSYVIGLVAHGTVLYVVAAVGPIPHWVPLALSVSGTVAWAYFSLRFLLRLWRRRSNGHQFTVKMVHRPSPAIWVRLALILLLLPTIFLTIETGRNVPVFGWDGIAIWASKSSALFHGEHLKSEFFCDENRLHAHPGYPIGLPLYQFHHTAVRGVFDEILVTRALAVAFFIWLLAFFDLVGEFAGRTAGIAACVILMYTPIFFVPAMMASPLSGFADFPIGAFVVLAVGWFNSWALKEGGVDMLGAAAALIAVAGIKNEGMVWVPVILGFGTVFTVVSRRKFRGPEWLLVVMPAISLVVIRVIHAHLPTSSDVHFPNLSEMKQLVSVMPQLAEIVGGAFSWQNRPLAFLPLIVVIGYALGFLRNWRNRYAMLALIGPAMWLIILGVMGLTEVELGSLDRFTRVTFPRLLFQAAPVSFFWAIVLNSPLFPHFNTAGRAS